MPRVLEPAAGTWMITASISTCAAGAEAAPEGSDAAGFCIPEALTVTNKASKSSFTVSCDVVVSSGLQTPAAYEGFDLNARAAQHRQASLLTFGTIVATLTGCRTLDR